MGPLMRSSTISFCECSEGPAPESSAPGLGAVELEGPPDSFCPFRVDFAELERSFFFCLPSSVEIALEVNSSVFLWDSAGRRLAVKLDGPVDLGESVVDGLEPGCDWSADPGVCAVDGGPGGERDCPVNVADPVIGREAGFRFPALDRLADLVVGGGRGSEGSFLISACSIPGVSLVGGRGVGLSMTNSTPDARKAEPIPCASICASDSGPDSRAILCISDRPGDAVRPDAASNLCISSGNGAELE